MTIPMLDCHQHLIYPDKWTYSWTGGIPALAGKAFRYEDYCRLVEGKGPIRTIFMETAPADFEWKEETRFVYKLADRPDTLIDGVVINCRPESEEDFEAYIESVRHPKLVGMRRILHVEPDETSAQPRFIQNVQRLARHNLTFDLCFLSRQLPLVHALAAKCPDNTFILDHCGVPDIAGGGLDPWREQIRKLASLPHVACKISGLTAYCSPDNAGADAIRPYVEHCIECFGWDRVVWGSDWPVCAINSGLPQWIDMIRELVAGETMENRNKLFHQNAERIYLKRQ
jgi:predicted TIM-barrel fold metal-dependent hydrolase